MREPAVFERIWNSTLGIPEQFVRRAFRIMTDPNVSILDQDGFMDAALLPIIGIFDKDRRDVLDEEFIDRINKQFGTSLDPEGFLAQVGTSLLTDPLSYLTSVPTASARLARAANLVTTNKAVVESGIKFNATDKISDIADKASEVLRSGKLASEDVRPLRKALGELRSAGDQEQSLAFLGGQTDRTQLAIAVPGLARFSVGRFATLDENYKSWWTLANKGMTSTVKGAAMLASPVLHVPGVGMGIRKLAQVQDSLVKGFQSAGGPLLEVNLNLALEEPRKMRQLSEFVSGVDMDQVNYLKETGVDTIAERLEVARNPQILVDQADELRGGLRAQKQKLRDQADALQASVKGKRGPEAKAVREKAKALRKQAQKLGKTEAGQAAQKEANRLKRQAKRLTLQDDATQFLRAMGINRVPKDADSAQAYAESIWRKINGNRDIPLPRSGDEFRETASRFLSEYDQAALELMHGSAEQELKVGLDKVNDPFFQFARNMRQAWNRKFHTDAASGNTATLAAEKEFRRNMALATQAFGERGKVMQKALVEAAKELRLPVADFERWMTNLLEGSALDTELVELSPLWKDDPTAFVSSVDKFVKRSLGASRTLQVLLKEQGGTEAVKAATLLGSALEDLDQPFDLLLKKMRTQRKGKVPNFSTLRGPRPGAHALEQVRPGEQLAYLDNKELNKILKSTKSKADIDAIEKELELRKRGLTKQAKRPEKIPGLLREPEGPIDIVEVRANTAEEFDGLGGTDPHPIAENMMRLLGNADQIRRAAREGAEISPVLIEEMTSQLSVYSRFIEDTVREALGEKGKAFLDYARNFQRELLKASIEQGTLHAGSPIAYLSRVLSNNQRQILRKVVSDIPTEVSAKIAPQLSTVFGRDFDAMTIEEVNAMFEEVKKIAPKHKFTEQLEQALNDMDLRVEKFSQSPVDSLLTKFAQVQSVKNTGDFINGMVAHSKAGQRRTLAAGRVVGVVSLDGSKIRIADKTKFITKTGEVEGEALAKIKRQVDPVDGFYRGIVVQDQETGLDFVISTNQFDDGFSLIAAGHTGDDIGTALGETAAFGRLENAQFAKGRVPTGQELQDLMGQHVLFGEIGATLGTMGMLQQQFKNTGPILSTYDGLHNLLKRFQTVYRPDFHVANLISSVGQTMMLGVGPKAMTGGTLDALRFLYSEHAGVIDDATRLFGKEGFTQRGTRRLKGLLPSFEFKRVVRRKGTLGGSITGSTDDAIYTVGNQAYRMDEILEVLRSEGVLGTFVSEGFRGSSTVPEALSRLREEIAKGGRGRAIRELGQDIGESSEIFARLSSVFAQLRQGIDLRTAAKQTMRVMVDYNDLTRFEQAGMKRIFSFYSFPRKFIPEAWRLFGKSPRMLGGMEKLLRSGVSSGELTVDNGRAQLSLPNGFALNLGRQHAGLDAALMIPAMVHAAGLMPGPGEELEGRPGLGEASAFAALGALPNLGYALLDSHMAGDKSFMQEAMRATPLTNWIYTKWTGGDPRLEDPTPLERLADSLLPINRHAPGHRRKVRMARFNALQRNLTSRLEDAHLKGDTEEVAFLRRELRSLSKSLRALNDLDPEKP